MAERDALPRVLFCIGGLARGGSETQLVTLVEALHGARLHATVVTLSRSADRRLVERLRRAGVRVLAARPARGPRAWRVAATFARVAALVALCRPDLIYAWLEEAALFTAPVARLLGVPFMVARRNIFGAYAGRGGAIVRAIHRCERQASVVTANSHAVLDETIARGVPRARVRLVPNAHVVDPAPPPPPPGEIALGYVAGFRAEKGHARLLEALARLRTPAAWHVDLAGAGPLRDAVAVEAGRRGLDGRVRFVGEVAEPRAFWAEHHVAVLLSDHEGSPNALIEAAMAGRPIVATDVGGVRDIVAPDGGALVPPDDPDAIAAALARLAEDGDLRRRAGAAARTQAIERFALEASVERHWVAIREALPA